MSINRRDFLRSIGAAVLLPGALAAVPLASGGIVSPEAIGSVPVLLSNSASCILVLAGADIKQGDFLEYVEPGVVVPYIPTMDNYTLGRAVFAAKSKELMQVRIYGEIPIRCE